MKRSHTSHVHLCLQSLISFTEDIKTAAAAALSLSANGDQHLPAAARLASFNGGPRCLALAYSLALFQIGYVTCHYGCTADHHLQSGLQMPAAQGLLDNLKSILDEGVAAECCSSLTAQI